MADGTIIINTEIDSTQAQKELNALTKKISGLSEKLNDLEREKLPLVEQSAQLGANLDAAKATLEHMKSGAEFFTSDSIANQQAQVNAMQKEFDSAALKVETINAKINKTAASLDNAKRKAGELSGQLAGARNGTKALYPAAEKASKRLEKLGNRIKWLARRVFVFTLITAALRKIREYMWSAIQTNTDAMAAVAKLKGALRTLAQPIVNIVIPAFTLLANVLTTVVNTAARLLSALFGTTFASSQKAAENLYDQQKAIKGVGSAAKKASKYLAPFDELNTMNGDSDSSGGASASGGIAPDFTSTVSSGLTAVATLFTGIALLALGAVLTFSGANIPIGIALMVAGALAVYGAASENWGLIAETLQGSLAVIVTIVAGALLALGIILVMTSTNIPLGIGMIIAGAASLAAVVAVNWDTIINSISDNIAVIAGIVGAAFLVLGAVLLFTGANIPLGIGLLVAGGASLVAAIAPNWNFITDKVKEVWKSVKDFWNSKIAPIFTAAWWANLGKTIMNGLISGVEAGINWVLGGIGDLVNSITGILNKIPGVNIGRVNWGNVHIPRLAQGAVIPANREFLAVLGDQKRGTNIEAPADLIRQIVREEVGQASGSTHVTIVLDSVDGKKLFDAIVKENNSVIRATGASPLKV